MDLLRVLENPSFDNSKKILTNEAISFPMRVKENLRTKYKDYLFLGMFEDIFRFSAVSKDPISLQILDSNKRLISTYSPNENNIIETEFKCTKSNSYYLRIVRINDNESEYALTAERLPRSVFISEPIIYLDQGQEYNPEIQYMPKDSTNTFTWTSSNPDIVSVNPENGTLNALKAGHSQITCFSHTGVLTVSYEGLASLLAAKTEPDIPQEDFENQLRQSIDDFKKKNINLYRPKAYIAQDVKATATVYVSDSASVIQDIQFSQEGERFSLYEGRMLDLAPVSLTPSNTSLNNITWKSSDESVAVCENGLITAKNSGNAIITCSGGVAEKTVEIEVLELESGMPEIIRIGDEKSENQSVSMSRKNWERSDSVIIVSKRSAMDGIAAAPAAHLMDSPVLIADYEIEQIVLDEIERLGAQKILLIGDDYAFSENTENVLSENHFLMIISGEDKYEVNLNIAKYVLTMQKSDTAVIAEGSRVPSALSVSSYAALSKVPIILLPRGLNLNEKTKDFLMQFENLIVSDDHIDDRIYDELSGLGMTINKIEWESISESSLIMEDNNFKDAKDSVTLCMYDSLDSAIPAIVVSVKNNAPMIIMNPASQSIFSVFLTNDVILEMNNEHQKDILIFSKLYKKKNYSRIFIVGSEDRFPAKWLESLN